MSSEPLSFAPITDRLVTPDIGIVQSLTTNLNQNRGALTALRAFHEHLQSPSRDLGLLSDLREQVNGGSKGVLDVANATKVQFSDDDFILKHGQEFSKTKDYRGFLFQLKLNKENRVNVIQVDFGSKKDYQPKSDSHKKLVAAVAMVVMGQENLAFVFDEGREEGYKVDSYFVDSFTHLS